MARTERLRKLLALQERKEKPRAQYFYRRSSYPLRDAAPLELEKYWENQHRYFRARTLKWQEAGPVNYSGRATCLLVDPKEPKRLYAGTAAGGLWVSENEGRSWTAVWYRVFNQNIGALAINPDSPSQLICATGEANGSPDSYPGTGVYFSEDGGVTWYPFFTAPGGGPLKPEARALLPRRIGSIAFGRVKSPHDPGFKETGKFGSGSHRIALGSVSADPALPSGLYLDEGASGLRPVTFWGDRSYNCHAVLFHPRQPGLLFAAIEPRGALNGVWRSEDSGKTWKQLTTVFPRGELCGRISLALAPSAPNILYALVASRARGVLAVLRSDSRGDFWQEIGGGHFRGEGQMAYNNTICVHPGDPDFVVCGGVDLHRLHRTGSGGFRWTKITTGERGDAGQPFPRNFVHFDHHAVVMPGGDVIYSANDGGIAVSEDAGETWHDRSYGMVTTMFYDVDVAPSNPKVFGGGAQDAGSLLAGINGRRGSIANPRKPKEFTRVLAGDGGWLVFDPANDENVFGSTAGLQIHRHPPREPWAAGLQLDGWLERTPPDLIRGEKELRAIVVMMMEPVARKGRKKLWLGTSRLWVSRDNGVIWDVTSPVFDTSAISAIEVSTLDRRVMYAGTSDGGIHRSLKRGEMDSWSANLAGPLIPRRLISAIEVHPAKAATVVVVAASTGLPAASLNGDNRSFSHVFQSDDFGQTWTDIDRGQLPNVVYNALAYETRPPFRLFVGGDAGVWMLGRKGVWISVTAELPNVVISDLVYHRRSRLLTAATYGRGIWRLKLPASFKVDPPSQMDTPPEDAPHAAGLIWDDRLPIPRLLTPLEPAGTEHHLRWSPAPGAFGYAIRVDAKPGGQLHLGSRVPEVRFSSPITYATWRVWTITTDGRRSSPSAAGIIGAPGSPRSS